MLKKIIAVSIISLLGFNTPLHAETSIPVISNTGFFSKAMQKTGDIRVIFGIGGGFDYLTRSKFSTSQVRYVTLPVLPETPGGKVEKKDIKDAINGDWSEGPYAAYPTKYKYQVYPEIELGVRYMPRDQCYIQVTANWQFMNKRLQFANLNKVSVVETGSSGVVAATIAMDYTAAFTASHPDVRSDINPIAQCVIGYVEGADALKVVKLKSRCSINLSVGKFINKTLCVGVDFGLSTHEFSINDSNKSTVGFIAGINVEHFFNSRFSLAGYTNYAFGEKKIENIRNTVRGLNFGARIRCHF